MREPTTDIVNETPVTLGHVAELAADFARNAERHADASIAAHSAILAHGGASDVTLRNAVDDARLDQETRDAWRNLANLARDVANLAGPNTPRRHINPRNANVAALAAKHGVDVDHAARVLFGGIR